MAGWQYAASEQMWTDLNAAFCSPRQFHRCDILLQNKSPKAFGGHGNEPTEREDNRGAHYLELNNTNEEIKQSSFNHVLESVFNINLDLFKCE